MKTNEKDTQQGVVPTLRFPEFSEAGEWVCLKGNKVFEQISNRKHSSNLPVLAISQEHGAVPRDLIDYKVIVSDEGLENYKVVETGDFIISLRSFQGGIEYSAYNGICSPAYIILRKRLDVDNQFFKYYFKSRAFIRDLNKNLEGIRDGKMVSYKQFSEILLPIPSIHNKKEQQKIADCLSSVDDLITAQTNRLEALRNHKKGLMQQLFPSEGKTVPALRFPEFQNAGEWKTPHLGQISTRITTKVGDSQLPPVSISAGIGFVTQTEKFGRDISGEQYCNYIELNKGEFAYNKGNSKKYPQGCVYRLKEFEKVAAPNAFICFRFDNDVIPDFFKGYFDSNYHGKQLQNVITSGARSNGLLNISADEFFNIILPTPKDKEEQQKIADCLSSVDDLITAQTNRLEALRNHKKGLMQQLFPNLNNHEE